jgi:hypothetical protein
MFCTNSAYRQDFPELAVGNSKLKFTSIQDYLAPDLVRSQRTGGALTGHTSPTHVTVKISVAKTTQDKMTMWARLCMSEP